MARDVDAIIAETIPKSFMRAVERWRNEPAIREKDMGVWKTVTWAEWLERSKAVAYALAAMHFRPGDVVSIGMDELAVNVLSGAVGGLLFVQPETTLAQQLQTLYGVTGTPVIVATNDRKVESADHTGDDLATVLRFKVKVQFVEPV